MTSYNRVVWSQGLFLTPEHLQQQERHLERYLEDRCEGLVPHGWGFTEIEIERSRLGSGEVGIRRAAGVFPDGTPFRIPDDTQPVTPLQFPPGTYDEIIQLAVPSRRDGMVAFSRSGRSDGLTRYEVQEVITRDVAAETDDGESTRLEVGVLRTRLLRSADATAAYSCLPVARVLDCRPDGRLSLDEGFMPTVLHVGAAIPLAAFVDELCGYLHNRGEELGRRLAAGGRGVQSDVADLLMLQIINRNEPLLAHMAANRRLHPEELYRVLASAAGEFATVTTDSRRPEKYPAYRHDRLRESFEPLMHALRRALSHRQRELATPIPLEDRNDLKVGLIPDPGLYAAADFVLGAKAQVPEEQLRRRFPASVKIASVSRIDDLIKRAVPGVPISAKAVAPPQIPFHSGFVYFALDQRDPLWAELRTSSGIAVFVPQVFPELELELWAVRR